MKHLNKKSLLLTVSPDEKLNAVKNAVIKEGLYFGYNPLDDPHYSLGHYLHRRTPNLYHFQYGDLADLTNRLQVKFRNEKSFQLKEAPRSAIGPDFKALIVGGKENFGQIRSITIRLTPLPEKISHIVVLLPNKDAARKVVSHLVGKFCHPLYFRHAMQSEAKNLLQQLSINNAKEQILLLSFSGLAEVVMAKKKVLFALCKEHDFTWFKMNEAEDVKNITDWIHTQESYREIREQYRQFLWPSTDNTRQSDLEKSITQSTQF
ncbi:MAG: hypothetical protein H7A33_04980 [Deltaproteobacteria bacterium]|nr:hypothetical protein [Deltaproteobacteria bacterium]